MESTKQIVHELFDLEQRNFGAKVGLLEGPTEAIPRNLLERSVASVVQLSHNGDSFSRRLAIQMLAVIWEYCDRSSREEIRGLFLLVLSRMGVAPSTQMIDEEYRRHKKYMPTGSYLGEVLTVLLQLEDQVTVCGKEYLLTDFQKEALTAVRKNRITGISAPTSAGKSFVLGLAVVEHLNKLEGNVLIIVPTLSLVSQVSRDIADLLRDLGITESEVLTAYRKDEPSAAFVLTQERAIAAIQEGGMNDISFLIVDEIQNIERVAQESEERSKILLDVLKELKDKDVLEKIVVSGPRLSNIGNLGFEIFGELSEEEASEVSPVVNFTYAIEKRSSGFWLNQYVDTRETPNSIRIDRTDEIAGIGKSEYNESFLDYLESVLLGLGEESRNLVFSPTTVQAKNTAKALFSRRQGDTAVVGEKIEELCSYIQRTVHNEYSLARTLRTGVAYHSSRVPPHVRVAIESAFRMGLIKDLICTTTLMQGVNLPATNIVVRNPRLAIRRRNGFMPELSAYEFSNLRGRAGRLLQDFIGRTIVLDESTFHVEGQEELFTDKYKEVGATYRDMFEEHESVLRHQLATTEPTEEGKEKFLLTYIRQTMLRMGRAGRSRLHEVGIALSGSDLEKVERSLSELTGPIDKYIRNRQWDPFDLEEIWVKAKQEEMPKELMNPFASDLAKKMHDLVIFHNNVAPYYVNRYLGTRPSEKYIWAVCYSAQQWAREDSLFAILSRREFTGDIDEEIERQISLIMNKVVYGITALLKPYQEIFSEGSSLLSAIEMGVHRESVRRLLFMGLSRETALRIRNDTLPDLGEEEFLNDKRVKAFLLERVDDLDFWTKMEVSNLLGISADL